MAKQAKSKPIYQSIAEEDRLATADALKPRLAQMSLDEIAALLEWHLEGLEEEDDRLAFLRRLPPARAQRAAGALPYAEDAQFLAEVEEFCGRIENEEFVQYTEYDPDEREYHGFGDDSWIEEMDALFDAAASYVSAGRYDTAIAAYHALFDCLTLQGEGGYYFTSSRPASVLRTDTMGAYALYCRALCHALPGPEAAERMLDEMGDHEHALPGEFDLNRLFPEGGEITRHLEEALLHWEQGEHQGFCPPPRQLLRQIYAYFRSAEEMEQFAGEHGARFPWIFLELARSWSERGNWAKVLQWSGRGLAEGKGLPDSERALLADHRVRAARESGDASAALTALWDAFDAEPSEERLWALRAEAQAQGQWEGYYPRLVRRLMPDPSAAGRQTRTLHNRMLLQILLAEGDVDLAIERALSPEFADAWRGGEDPRLLVVDFVLRVLARGRDREALGRSYPEMAARLATPPEYLERLPTDLGVGDIPAAEFAEQIEGLVRIVRARAGQSAETGYQHEEAARDVKLVVEVRRMQRRPEQAEEFVAELFRTYNRKRNFRSALREQGFEAPAKR